MDGVEKEISQLCEDCWNKNPLLRPNFFEIIKRLNRIFEKELEDEKKEEKENKVNK